MLQGEPTPDPIAPVESGNAILDGLESLLGGHLPGWLLWLGAALVAFAIAIGLISLVALFAVWMERKVSGHIQCRLGPMRVGVWHGWAQSLADALKLFMKEDMIPKGSDRLLFVLAPAIVLGSIIGAVVAYPLAPGFYFADVNLGVFFIVAMASMTTIGVVMAGWASNSKWSLYGAMRQAAQVVAYEIPLGISLMVPVLVCGSFNLLEVSGDQAGLWGMNWYIFRSPFMLPAFLLFFTAGLAETKRAPFDLPETESELVAGFMTEYSGLRWSFFFMEEYAAMFLISAIAAIFWFGGFESPLTWGAHELYLASDGNLLLNLLYQVVAGVTLLAKTFAGIFLMMWIRWTVPRVRIDQVMTMGYKYLTPLALACLACAAIWEALWVRLGLPERLFG